MSTIKPVTAEQVNKAYEAMEPYLLALGKVANTWNHLHEDFARLFAIVTQQNDRASDSVWHSIRNDRGQRNKLKSAIRKKKGQWVEDRLKTVADDLMWLLDEADSVAEKRNNAIHSPLIPSIKGDQIEIVPFDYYQNPRAENLRGKDILQEYSWYQKSTEALTSFARQAANALRSDKNPWPSRPEMPTRE